MCDNDAKSPLALHFSQPCAAAAQAPAAGSRRRRLWDLPHACLCPVVGVCLPLDTLRQLVNKAAGGKTRFGDYELHVGAVAQCERRTPVAERMQDELERRYAREIKALRLAKTAEAVAVAWATAVRQGDVAGTFWAALSHPRCDDPLQERLCRDMHMLQHQAGALVRTDSATLQQVLDENALLARELARVQERSTRLLAEKNAEAERQQLQLLQLRAEAVAKDSRYFLLADEMAVLKASNPGLDAGLRLQRKVAQLLLRQRELETQNTGLRQQLAAAAKLQEARLALAPSPAITAAQETGEPAPVTVCLQQQTVLCVGGRSGSIANYRALVERVGGRFAHHDGGLEDRHNVLDTSLAAADLVICQTGCISHNAYWKVKEFCKRTGKRCVFVENPSASSLARGLEQMASPQGAALQETGSA